MGDRELISAVIRGDPESGDEFVHRYTRLLWHILRQHGIRDLEDATQSVFQKLWDGKCAALRRWHGEERFDRYLAAIVRNFANDLHRADRRVLTNPGQLPPDLFDPRPGPFADARRREREQAARSALAQLPPADQDLYRRVYIDGETPAAIAAALGITTNNVYQRMFQLKRRLKEVLGQLYPGLFDQDER